MEYIIWCDESVKNGKHYSDFYGGILVRSVHLREVNDRLRGVLDGLKYPHEAKWQNITAHTLEVYEAFVITLFKLMHEDKVKVRIMFRQSAHLAQNLTTKQRERSFHLLYYQFIKHSFGWPHANATGEAIHLRLYFDKLPDKAVHNEAFMNHIFALQRLDKFRSSQLVIRAEDIAEVDSRTHVELQALDVVLGAMAFRLNDLHKVIPEGKRRRGKRTVAKEKLYKTIRKEIEDLYPRFNIGESTGSNHRRYENRWSAPYRHWKFLPRDFIVDESRYK